MLASGPNLVSTLYYDRMAVSPEICLPHLAGYLKIQINSDSPIHINIAQIVSQKRFQHKNQNFINFKFGVLFLQKVRSRSQLQPKPPPF